MKGLFAATQHPSGVESFECKEFGCDTLQAFG
jgi:hypothetical protein